MPTRRKKPENAGYLSKAPTEAHSGFADYIEATTGFDLGDYSGELSLVVGLVQRLYPLYLKSPAVIAAREADQAAKDAEKRAKDAERHAKLQARLDRVEEQRTKLLAELGLVDASDIPDSISVSTVEPEVEESVDEFIRTEDANELNDNLSSVEDDSAELQAEEVTIEDDGDDQDDWDDDGPTDEEEDF